MTQLLGVRLDDTVHLRFKLLCVQQKVSMTEVVERLIEAWIAEQEQETGQSADREEKEADL